MGKYYSQRLSEKKILRQTDQEIVEEDEKIEKEIKAGIPDPAPIDPETGQPMEPSFSLDSIDMEADAGKVPVDIEDKDGESTEV